MDSADEILARGVTLDEIRELARKVRRQASEGARVYVAVIGVYSDVKVLTLLGGLLARYDLPNLAVSDTLTISPTLERHIAGLDFAAKVMQIEVVHGVNDLVRYLGGKPPLESESTIVEEDGFAQYQTFFKDKQSVLAYQSEKLQDYLVLTEKRALNDLQLDRALEPLPHRLGLGLSRRDAGVRDLERDGPRPGQLGDPRDHRRRRADPARDRLLHAADERPAERT